MNVHEFVASYQFDASDDGIFHTPDDAEKAMLEDAITTYLEATAPSGQAPLEGVKALEWKQGDEVAEHAYSAATSVGRYVAAGTLDGNNRTGWFLWGQTRWFDADTLEAAKAAAQADYEARIRSAPLPAGAEPVAHIVERLDGSKRQVMLIEKYDPRKPEFWVNEEARAHHRVIPLYASPPASGAVEAGPEGLSEWEGWDRSRGDWSETKHKDAVLAELFGAWSMEDAATLIGFIDRTWTKRPASPREGR